MALTLFFPIGSTTLDHQEGPKMVFGQWWSSLAVDTLLRKVLQGERLALPCLYSTLFTPSPMPHLAQGSMFPAYWMSGHTMSAVWGTVVALYFREVISTSYHDSGLQVAPQSSPVQIIQV